MAESGIERCRILVVEEDRDAADALTTLLELWGHDVHTVYGGRSALESIERDPPELALVDVGMVEVDGHEVARRVLARMGAGAPMLVAMSGNDGDKDVERSLRAGFDRHLGKPTAPETIEAAIRDCLARKSARQS
jgi:CheY-like chemotaxis protein